MKEQASGIKSPVIKYRRIQSLIVLQDHTVHIPKKLDSKSHRSGKGLLRSSSLVCSFSDKETEDQKCDLLMVTRSHAPFKFPLLQHQLHQAQGFQ